jgi:hypothetical protein
VPGLWIFSNQTIAAPCSTGHSTLV